MNNERDAADVDQLWGALSDACHFDRLRSRAERRGDPRLAGPSRGSVRHFGAPGR